MHCHRDCVVGSLGQGAIANAIAANGCGDCHAHHSTADQIGAALLAGRGFILDALAFPHQGFPARIAGVALDEGDTIAVRFPTTADDDLVACRLPTARLNSCALVIDFQCRRQDRVGRSRMGGGSAE